jgi:hypothetical protein
LSVKMQVWHLVFWALLLLAFQIVVPYMFVPHQIHMLRPNHQFDNICWWAFGR